MVCNVLSSNPELPLGMVSEELRPPSSRAPPMEERVIRLPVSTAIKALFLVQEGAFASFDEVVEAGIESLTSERVQEKPRSKGSAAVRESPRNRDTGPSYIAQMEIGQHEVAKGSLLVDLPLIDPVEMERIDSQILLFTTPRFFPLKIIIRALGEELRRRGERMIDLDDFRLTAGPRALEWRQRLDRLDRTARHRRGERIATALPSESRDLRRSLDRFLDVYVGYLSDDGRCGGASVFLGLASLEGTPETTTIGLTE